MRKIVFLMSLVCFMSHAVQAAERFVTFSPESDALPVHGATISFSDNDYDGVKIAIRNLQSDMEAVFGQSLLSAPAKPTTILIGTVGKNPDIDRLKIENLKGKREMFVITIVDGKIVIAGSDRRGTIYGIYELSRQLGVSPWYWWADVPVERHAEAYVKPGV